MPITAQLQGNTIQGLYGNGVGQAYANPDQAALAAANLNYAKAAGGDVSVLPDTGKSTSEPAAMSTGAGRDALNSETTAHNAMVSTVAGATPTKTDTKAPNDASVSALKAAGGVTADEASASGLDLSQYQYDPSSQYYLPKNGTGGQQTQFNRDLQTINSAFSDWMGKLDSSTASLISGIKDLYAERINTQKDINEREYKSFNTMNVRSGTDRYAPGVAQTILTADENAGLDRIKSIESEMLSAINGAQANLTDKKYTAFMQQRSEIKDLQKEYQTNIKDLQDKAIAARKDQLKRQQDLDDKLSAAKEDAMKTANKNGAPSSVLQSISDAKTSNDAYKAIAGYGGHDNLSTEKIGDNMVVYDKNTNTIVKVLDTSQYNGGGNKTPLKEFADFLVGKTPDQVTAFNSLSDTDKSNVSQLINGDALLSDLVTTRGVAGTSQRQALLQKAQAIDPTFSENTNKIRYNFNKEWNDPTNKLGMTRNAINTALGHLAEVSTLSKALPAGTVKAMNSVDNVLNKQFGDPSVTNFRIAINALASEMAQAYKGGVPDEGEIKEFRNSLAESFSKAQLKGVMDTASSLLSSKVTATRYAYKSTMGKEYAQSLIDPDKKQALIDSGIDPNSIAKEKIPGQEAPVSETERKINDTLNSTNPATGKPYTSQDLVDYWKTSPDYKTKVTRLVSAGYSADDIVNFVKTLP